MADYSAFPFDRYTVDEIAQMMISSVQLGDAEFVSACREQIKRRRPVVAESNCIQGAVSRESGEATDEKTLDKWAREVAALSAVLLQQEYKFVDRQWWLFSLGKLQRPLTKEEIKEAVERGDLLCGRCGKEPVETTPWGHTGMLGAACIVAAFDELFAEIEDDKCGGR